MPKEQENRRGEGDYNSGAAYQDAATDFSRTEDTEQLGREAAADLDEAQEREQDIQKPPFLDRRR